MAEVRFHELFAKEERIIAAKSQWVKLFKDIEKDQKVNWQKLVKTKRKLDFLEDAHFGNPWQISKVIPICEKQV